MTPREAENLLLRYAAQQCTEHEENQVNSWFNKVVRETKYPDTISMNVNAMSDDWDRLIAKRRKQVSSRMHKTLNIGRYVAAAVAAGTIAIGVLLYYKPSRELHHAAIATTLDTTVSHRNKDFSTTLPDGTLVYLNGASSVRYAKGLKGPERKVFLEGEAYFEVRPDRDRPFIVCSREQEVRVVGTHFNVSSYDGESIKTTLLEGAIELTTTRNKKQKVLLRPGFQATLGTEGFEVKEVDPDSAISWKAAFVFNQTPLKNVLKELGRWYNVGVDSSQIATGTLDAVYDKNATLQELLNEITQSTGVKLVLQKNVITID